MDESAFRPTLERALEHALAHLSGLATSPVAATASDEQLRSRFCLELTDGGMDAAQVVDELVRAAEGGILGSAGGRFFGWVIGGSLPAALAAEWLTAAWDQNATIQACSPAAAMAEEAAGAWLKSLLGLPESASFAFTSGCQMAHLTALAAARNQLLAAQGWDVETLGLQRAPLLKVIAGPERHGSVDRALRQLGLGSPEVSSLDPAELAPRLDERTILVLQAGEINTGRYDDLACLIPLAHQRGAWVHVDGAFGLWAAASPTRRHLLRGHEQADSWATDGHKWLNVPYDCGYAFVAHPEPHRRAMGLRASYLAHASEARDQIDWTPDWSRRARGFATWAALRQLGRDGVAAMIDRCCDHALALTRGIAALPGAELVAESSINQGLVSFGDRTDAVCADVCASGEAFFSPTTWRGRRAMRISVCNWQTSEEDVARSIAAVRSALLGGN